MRYLDYEAKHKHNILIPETFLQYYIAEKIGIAKFE
jgi:hypothetical protein